jgi:serine/threonine protein phosphatase 1
MNWIIGDIHGYNEKFEALLSKIDAADPDPQIICVGDYCDRGPDSKSVVDRILRSGIKCVRGNHDDVFTSILEDTLTGNSDFGKGLEALHAFFPHGAINTLNSYGVSHDVVVECYYTSSLLRITDQVPESHKLFYRELPIIIERDDFFVMHATLAPDCPLDQFGDAPFDQKAALWGRYPVEMIAQDKAWGKHGYFGHTPTYKYGSEGPLFGNSMTLIDTGVVSRRPISAICHETKQVLTSNS